jgi:hypothetical protein
MLAKNNGAAISQHREGAELVTGVRLRNGIGPLRDLTPGKLGDPLR